MQGGSLCARYALRKAIAPKGPSITVPPAQTPRYSVTLHDQNHPLGFRCEVFGVW